MLKPQLLNVSAATLDQNAQHDGEENAGNDANYSGLIHE
jgi:hypothetical protein